MLSETLKNDMKAAMKAREAERLTTIRMLISALKNEEIALRRALTPDEEIALLATQAKRRRESITAFEDAGRDEMAAQERAELAVIEGYLPAQLSADEVGDLARGIIAELGASGPGDMGRVMGQLMPRLKGRFPGADVRPIVQGLLTGKD